MNQTSTDQDQPAFEAWLRIVHGPAHSRRTAERNAAFLLPHLQPGMSLLDAGCGPGSITVGLARAVAPGEVVGIDTSADRIGAARAHAEASGCANARFEVADVTSLPFEDATFDAVFAHCLLQHLPFPLDAVIELRRVTKAGGVIGLADADFDGAIIAPESDELAANTALMRRMRRNPHIGKHLRALLAEAGCARTVASVSANALGERDAAKINGEWNARYVEAEPFIAHVTSKGWATRDELRAQAAAWRAWGSNPGAFSANFACQAVGWVE